MLSLKSMNIPVSTRAHRTVRTGAPSVQWSRAVGRRQGVQENTLKYYLTRFFAVGVLFFIVLYGMYAVQTSLGYQMDKSNHELKLLHQENDRLHVDVAQLKSPSRIQRIALKDLGMAMPEKFIYSSSKASIVKEKQGDKANIRD